MAACPAFDPLGPFVGGVTALVDCHSLALGEEGWRALGASSPFGAALGGLMVIAVALLGYRTVMGEIPSLRDGVTLAVRIGLVFALATQWSAYRPLIYDLATRAPEDLAGAVLAPGGLGGGDRQAVNDRVDAVGGVLSSLLHGGVAGGRDAAAQAASHPAADQVAAPPVASPDLPSDVLKSADASNTVLLTSTLAGELSARVPIGLLLALGPLFVAGLLFESTQRLFVSWLRVLAGAALASIAVPMVIALELAILEPQVMQLRQQLEAQAPLGALPEQVFATTLVFALVMLAALIALAWAAAGLRLPGAPARQASGWGWATASAAPSPPLALAGPSTPRAVDRSRAQSIADAARSAEQRDARLLRSGSRLIGPAEGRGRPAGDTWTGGPAAPTTPARRTQTRVSAGATRRDSQA